MRAHQFGGNTAVVRLVPIPNTTVKRCMADGSGCIASARVGSRQSFKLNPEKNLRVFFIILYYLYGGENLSGENLPNHVLDRHFLNINIADRLFVEQSLAGWNDAVALYLKFD